MSKISQKKTCNSCQAFALNKCGLGYEIKHRYDFHVIMESIPQEPCPKPLTNDQYIKERNKKWWRK